MVRPAAKELTERELEVMHLFWTHGVLTADEARLQLENSGVKRTYVTVANLVRILLEKKFLKQVNSARPFQYQPIRSFDDVSRKLVGDLMQRVFRGSREQLLVNLLGQKKLSPKERALLEQILREQDR